jgi:phosphate starvation-inducible PhoH-like protein
MTKKNNSLQVHADELVRIEPITENQRLAFSAWEENKNIVLSGSAGTGKTFIGLYLALKAMLDEPEIYRDITIMRSIVPTRDGGFLPGTIEEKREPFNLPYKFICNELFGEFGSYNKMLHSKQIKFESTSYIRGCTFDHSIILVDEMQNLNFHELDSVITRIGKDCRVIFCGDYMQSDFKFDDEKDGIIKFMKIVEQMRFFDVVKFGWEDIVRSDLVRDYIMTKEMLDIS